jgi:hypothetical protein
MIPDTKKYSTQSGIVGSKSEHDLVMSNITQESSEIFPKSREYCRYFFKIFLFLPEDVRTLPQRCDFDFRVGKSFPRRCDSYFQSENRFRGVAISTFGLENRFRGVAILTFGSESRFRGVAILTFGSESRFRGVAIPIFSRKVVSATLRFLLSGLKITFATFLFPNVLKAFKDLT